MRKVLIIDDDQDDIEIFNEALKEIDSSIVLEIAKNGLQGLQVLNGDHKPDLIFVDLNMPLVDGCEFLRKIKKEDSLKEIPVIVYTTSSREEDKRKCFELGASEFLTKASNFEDLLTSIKTVLS